ncbi:MULTISPECIES: helix-turn-helix domain-containing protein [unclassified Streptomyces]|uniref:MmyB family transcriptional regulator n=1 Tax=unclassified Streptomyces TaxID=2593676 RepID=UPI0036456F91
MNGDTPELPIITRVLRQARTRCDTSDIPGFTAAFGERAAPGITQEETARLAGVSRRWYNSLEAGRSANYSDGFLQAVRRILTLSNEEWHVVYHGTRGHAPAGVPVSPLTALLPDPLRDLVVNSQTCLYISDHRWDVLASNARNLEIFPWMKYGINVMEWALCWPEARAQLIDWKDEWALPMMAQLRFHAEQYRSDERLREVISTVRGDPTSRKLWNDPALPTMTHPASQRPRRLYLPKRGGKEFAVHFLAFAPLELPSCRLMAVTPAEVARTDGRSTEWMWP